MSNNVASLAVSVGVAGTYPVADAGPDQEVEAGDTVQFDGTGSYFPGAETVKAPLWTLDISADGNYLAVGWGRNISFFNTGEPQPLWTYESSRRIQAVVLSDDGRYLAAAENDVPEDTWDSRGAVSFFDTSAGEPLWTYQTDYPLGSGLRKAIDITADGSMVVAGTQLWLPAPYYLQKVGSIYLFGKDSPSPLAVYPCPKSVMTVEFSGDSTHFAVGTYWWEARLYSVASGLLWTKTGSDPYYSVALDEGASRVASAQGSSKRTHLFNNAGGLIWTSTAYGPSVNMRMSADGRYLGTGEYGDTGAFRLYDTSSPTPIWTAQLPGFVYAIMDMSSDGSYMVGGTSIMHNDTYLFTKDSSTPVFTHSADGNVWDVACSADGSLFASVTQGGTLSLFASGGEPRLLWQWSSERPAPGSELTYSWDFDASVDLDGDGDPANDAEATGPTPTHTYLQPGIYLVTLTVTAQNGLSDTDTMTVTVAALPASLEISKVKISGIDEGVTHTYYEWVLQISVTNVGGRAATDVEVRDMLPAELGLLELVASNGEAISFVTGTRALPPSNTIGPVRSTHITWTIDSMAPGETETLTMRICTRLNPAGRQEFTSPGVYSLNDGAWLTAVDSLTGEGIAAGPTAPITVTILEQAVSPTYPYTGRFF
jgi:PKD repeat protein